MIFHSPFRMLFIGTYAVCKRQKNYDLGLLLTNQELSSTSAIQKCLKHFQNLIFQGLWLSSTSTAISSIDIFNVLLPKESKLEALHPNHKPLPQPLPLTCCSSLHLSFYLNVQTFPGLNFTLESHFQTCLPSNLFIALMSLLQNQFSCNVWKIWGWHRVVYKNHYVGNVLLQKELNDLTNTASILCLHIYNLSSSSVHK